jgi:SAM-dependent methyltransferase
MDAVLRIAYALARLVVRPTRRLVVWLRYARRYPMEARFVGLDDLGVADEHRVFHLPSSWMALPRILPRSEVRAEDVFIDFGSGMGRIVVLAARRYRLRRVIGVEISVQLHEIAERNIERNRRRLRCQDVELVNADVLEYRIPDDVSIVYLYHPFTGPIFEHVVAELGRSVDRNPREIRIIYLNPVEEERLLASGRVAFVRSAWAGGWRNRHITDSVRLYVLRPWASRPA